jgi:predicted HTH transcriptional regulator
MDNNTKTPANDEVNFDDRPIAEASVADLDADQLKEFVAKVIAKKELKTLVGTDDAILSEMKMTAKVGTKICPTVSGLLLFGKNPQKYLWSSSVKMVRFSGKDKSGHIIEQNELRGTIPQMVNEAEHFLVRNMKLYGSIQGVKRTDVPEYPLDALREVLINALIHRDYSVSGSTCRVYMFDDKIEFYSPGSLCHPINVTNIENTQYLRNKNIVEGLYYLGGYVEKLGTGITRLKSYLKDAGLKDPKYLDNGTDFIVVIYGPEDRVMQIEKTDRAKKLRKAIGLARKPEDVDDTIDDFKKEDREILEEKLRHEKKKEEAALRRRSMHKRMTLVLIIFFAAVFSFFYIKRVNSAAYLFERAADSHAKKEYQRAAKFYKKFVLRYPKNPLIEDAYYFLGACYEMLGDDGSAVAEYKKVIDMFPNGRRKGYSQFWVGKLLYKEKKYQESIDSYRAAIGVHSEKELIQESLKNIADCYTQLGKYEDVVKTYEELLKYNESVSDGSDYYEMALAYEKMGDMDRAKEQYLNATMNKGTTLEWLEKARNRLMLLEGEKFKEETN